MATNSNLLYDGYSALVGVDGSLRPLQIPRHMVSRAFNCTFRGNEMAPRPGVRYQDVSFESEFTLFHYQNGRYQGAIVYTNDNGQSHFIVVKGGRVFRIRPTDWIVEEITIRERTALTAEFTAPVIGASDNAVVVTTVNLRTGMKVQLGEKNYTIHSVIDPTTVRLTNVDDDEGEIHAIGTVLQYYDVNPGRFFQVWMVQAEKWLLIQDGESRCIIYDGVSCRRSAGNEIPIGRSMTYGNGRVWLEMPDSKSFTAGDLMGDSSGTAAERFRDAVLKWESNTFLAEGGSFRIPTGAGDIRGMRFISNLDTSLGQGPLQIFTTNGSFSVNAPWDKTAWLAYNADASPIQTVSLTGGGAESERSLVQLNSDILFRSMKGIRSFQIGRQTHSRWVNTPMSKQVNWVIDQDQPALIRYGSAVEFDQRYIVTCAPRLGERGIVHQGFVSLDFDQVTWLDNSTPEWDGLWTFTQTYQILTGLFEGEPKCYVFSENHDSNMELFEITRDLHYDQPNATLHTKIRWGAEFASISFQSDETSGRFDLKALEGGEMFLSDVEGEVTFKVRYRPDGYSCWIPWTWQKVCTVMGACPVTYLQPEGCRDWSMGKSAPFGPLGFGRPPSPCDEANGRPLSNLYAVQIRLDMRGYAVFSSMRLAAAPLIQPPVTSPRDCSLLNDL